MNFYYLLAIALVPLVIGSIWYNPKVFGNAWMKVTGVTEEIAESKASGMWKTYLAVYFFSLLYAAGLMGLVIHQFGAIGMIGGDPATGSPAFQAFMAESGKSFRTFGHGALHGLISSIMLGFFFVGTTALFEFRSWKFIFIHMGYFILTSVIMGGLICQFL